MKKLAKGVAVFQNPRAGFPFGTPILKPDGTSMLIEDVDIKASVVTHEGRPSRVRVVRRFQYTGDLVIISVGGGVVETTPQSALMVFRGEPVWLQSVDISKDDWMYAGVSGVMEQPADLHPLLKPVNYVGTRGVKSVDMVALDVFGDHSFVVGKTSTIAHC